MSPAGSSLRPDVVREFPKVELHVHVESCIAAETIATLAAQQGVEMLRPTAELFTYGSLAEFLDTYEWWCDLLKTPEIAEEVAYEAAAMVHADGIVYAEMLAGPKYWAHVHYAQLLPALCAGFDRAQRDGYTNCRLVPSISREQSVEWANGLVDWIARAGLPRIVGLGLDGNEVVTGRTCPKFERVYARAAAAGLGRTVHAGESSGPEGVRDALDYLHVDRIDHGVRAIEDPALVDRLWEEQVTLNVCPTSNLILGLYPDLGSHPVARLMDAGIPVTVNSDDPQSMRVSLTGEFIDAGAEFGWAMTDVIAGTRRAIDAAFCDQQTARELRATVSHAVAAIPVS